MARAKHKPKPKPLFDLALNRSKQDFCESLDYYLAQVGMLESTIESLLSIDGMINPKAATILRERLDGLRGASLG
jgi:hypothetical protein